LILAELFSVPISQLNNPQTGKNSRKVIQVQGQISDRDQIVLCEQKGA